MRWPQLKIKNKKTAIFLVCIGVSAFFWLLIKLSKEYEITVNLPVKYENIPNDKLLINKPDSILLLKFTDYGFDLVPYSLFGAFSNLKIDVQKLNYKKLPNEVSLYYTKTDLLTEQINKMMSSKNYISVIRPDSLVLRMLDLEEKKVRVIPNVEYALSPQYQLKNKISCEPDSIIIYGSKPTLSEIEELKTEKLVFYDLNESIIEYSNIIFPNNTNSNVNDVALNIEVEKFTESDIHIPLKNHFIVKGNFKIFPSHLDIKYAVSFEKFKSIETNNFKIEIKKDSLVEGRLNIKLLEYPEHVRIIDFSPKVAEYIIIK